MDEGRPAEDVVDPVDGAPVEDFGAAPVEDVPFEPRGPSRGLIAIAIIVIGSLVIFAALGGRIVTADDPVTPSRSDARLAVTDSQGRFYTMDADGGSIVEHALPGLQFGFPAWSPDGSEIAITGQGDDGVRLYLFDAAEGGAVRTEPTILYEELDHPPFYQYWAPDGRQIGFLTSQDDTIALRLVPADGSAEAAIVREGAPLYWDWLGNDRLVAHIGLSGDGSFLGEVDLRGASTESNSLDPGFFRSPAVSRDRAYRAYVTTGQDSTGVVTLEAIDGSIRQVAPVFGVAAVSFDPTGSMLAYVAAERPPADDPGFPLGPLKLLDPASGKSRTLLEGRVVGFFWSPDGATIAALTLDAPDEEVVGVPGAGLTSAVGPAPGPGIEVDPPPPAQGVELGLAFVDVDAGEVRSNRAITLTSRFVNNILPYYDQYALSHRIWSPDSSAIALPLEDDGGDQLFVIPADGSDMTPLAGADLGFWSP